MPQTELVLVQTTFEGGNPRLNWESFPRVPRAGWSLMEVPAEDVSAYLLGKKFLNGELTAMEPEEAQAQLDAIATQARPVPGQLLYPTEFLGRFTDPEREDLYLAAATELLVAVIKDGWFGSPCINLCDPDLAADLAVLVERGLLTAERAEELLSV